LGLRQYALASSWTRSTQCQLEHAAALPSSPNAVGILIAARGAMARRCWSSAPPGSLGWIAMHLTASARGASRRCSPAITSWCATRCIPSGNGPSVHRCAVSPRSDASAGRLPAKARCPMAIQRSPRPALVMTLADEHAGRLGRCSVAPTPDRAPKRSIRPCRFCLSVPSTRPSSGCAAHCQAAEAHRCWRAARSTRSWYFKKLDAP